MVFTKKFKSMKKGYFLIPVIGIMISCAGQSKKTEKANEELQMQIEKMDETIKSSELEIEKSQTEIDSLLNNI